jgi:DNA-directed RNA polymerase specialized sigma24 family protein
MTTPSPSQQEVTQLLADWSDGDDGALDKLIPLVQPKLHRLAHHYMSIVELRYFGGLTEEETAAFLKLSDRTVRREWRIARTWLYRALSGKEPDET